MHQFDYACAAESLLTPHIARLLTTIHEAKGRQNVQIDMRPEAVRTLVDVARIQSTDASNRIEGIATSDRRLNALMLKTVTPRNRDEEEIAGYRDVLALIHDNHDYIPLTPNVILQLHRDLFRHTPLAFGGRFKDSDNVIVERSTDGTQTVRFAPPSALMTPELITRACDAFNEAVGNEHVDPLLAIAMFTFDFTCIHPFNDGNGRMSRLLTLLLMYRNGFEIGKYISIEHIIEQTKDTYYDALAASTRGWNDSVNDYAPFAQYLLGTILTAYREFDERIGQLITPTGAGTDGHPGTATTKPSSERRIAALFERTLSPMSKADVLAQLPDISVSTVERTLKRMLDAGEITKIGAGRATRYVSKR
ncbi:Fic family protein [Bifidobacterium aerophilum]|uniref:Cell filamentation protein Fic n=1 Tax=Bifidobacterium aerophilum TaxID=1798155 RepID=A0A6N9Z669_9BIFI|nr:Fic family protein [Bifidobacterium aerophilum]NEG89936.1 cell filamentation protein Fic [Bifidobacterium aerophilum]